MAMLFPRMLRDHNAREYRHLLRTLQETKSPERRTPYLRGGEREGEGIPDYLWVHFYNPLWKRIVGYSVMRFIDCDEIYRKLFVGSESVIHNPEFMQNARIAAILNCSEGSGDEYCLKPDLEYFKDLKINYHGFRINATVPTRLKSYLDEGSNFIHEVISNGNRALVYSKHGFTRAPAMAVAYLIKRVGMSTAEAVCLHKSKRDLEPKFGMLKLLLKYENVSRTRDGMCEKMRLRLELCERKLEVFHH